MIKLGGVVEDGQNTQRAKYIISTTVPNSNTITLNGSELIPINWDGRLITQHTVPVNELGKQLLKAAADGNIDKVKQLLTKGAPFTADWLGTSPLHLAAQNNHLEITEILLRAGISKDARTKVDRTPLHMASYEGHVNVVEALIRHGADINSKDLLDMTPLHWAVQNGHFEVVAYLARSGALIDVASKFDVTPIILAQQTERSDIEQLLIGALNDSTLAAQNLVLELNANDTLKTEPDQMFNETVELESPENEEISSYTVVREPILIEEDSQQLDGEGSQDFIEQEDQEMGQEWIEKEQEHVVHNLTINPSVLNSLKTLQEHGITLLQNDANDDGSILNSVMASGHSVVLTDVGKEVLNSIKQSEFRKQSQTLQMDKKIVSVTPEQFLAMTNKTNNKALRQLKVIPAKGTFKRVVMKKNKILATSTVTYSDMMNPLPSINKENPTKADVEELMKQLIEARKTIQDYRIKLIKKEQETEKYKMEIKSLMDPS